MKINGEEPTIVIDTREQTPWTFPGVNTTVQGLKEGDYTLLDPAHTFCIERKSLNDYVQTIIHHRDRFKNELCRLKENYESSAIIVEGDLFDIKRHRYVSKAHPNAVMGMACAIIIDFKIGVYFASNANEAQWMARSLLLRVWKNHMNNKTGDTNNVL